MGCEEFGVAGVEGGVAEGDFLEGDPAEEGLGGAVIALAHAFFDVVEGLLWVVGAGSGDGVEDLIVEFGGEFLGVVHFLSAFLMSMKMGRIMVNMDRV